MMLRRNLLLAFGLLFIFSLSALSQKMLTVEDISGMNRNLYPKYIKNLSWRANSELFTYQDNNALVQGDVNSPKRDTILRIGELSEKLGLSEDNALKRLPYIYWLDYDRFYFNADSSVYIYDLTTGAVKDTASVPGDATNQDFETHTFQVAYTIDNNLYISRMGEQVQITNDEDPGIVNGQTVSRNEFGIKKGTFWSPKGKYLAYYQKDEREVTDYPLVNINTRPASVKNIKYPMTGMTSEQLKLFVYNPETKENRPLKIGGMKDQYLTCVTWDPNEEYIYIAVLNRDQNHLSLNKYSVSTGEFVKTLFEETSPKYVEPQHPLFFPAGMKDRFVWFSSRDGFQHLYLYDTDGNLIRQLTSGNYVVKDISGSDPKGRELYFLSTMESPLNQDVFAVEFKSGKIRKISPENGSHYVIFNDYGKYYFDIYSDTLTARVYEINSTKGKTEQVLQENQDPLKDYETGKTSVITLKTEEGIPLYARIITPPNLDINKKYPAIVYVYGGPHDQEVTNSWTAGAGLFLNYLAEQGYVVFTLDNRGSANRGMKFEQAIFRNLGTLEVTDQMTGVNYLKSLPFVDPDRIGVNGWSYGGFMTVTLMLKQADAFKVGVCGGPVTDWKFYEVMYGERYMDTPETNPEGYAEASLLNKADSLKGKLLMIHGTYDPVVVWQNTLTLLQKFIEANKQVDYFVYPGHEHGVSGKDRLNLNQKMLDYFRENL